MRSLSEAHARDYRQHTALRRALATTTLLLSLFPYVGISIFRAPTEVQPWAALFAWGGIMILALSGRAGTKIHEMILLFFGLFFLVYVPVWSQVDILSYLRKSSSVLLSLGIVLLSRSLEPLTLIRALKVASLIWFAFASLGAVSPSLYHSIIKFFVPNALGAYGERGATSLAPEATDFGFTMVYYFMLLFLASVAERDKNRTGAPLWLYLIIVLNVFLSGAASGIFGLIIITSVLFFFFDVKTASNRFRFRRSFMFISLSCLLLLVAIQIGLFEYLNIRGVELLLVMLSDPSAMTDTTLSYRLAHNLVGIYGMLESNFIGFGGGTFLLKARDLYFSNNVGELLDLTGWYAINVPNTLSESPLSMVAVLLFEYGVFGLLFLLYCLWLPIASRVLAGVAVAALLFLTLSQSFPLAYPLFWVLVGVVQNPRFRCRV